MTKQAPATAPVGSARCQWCGRPFTVDRQTQGGRPAKYCRRSCRQRMYESRQRAAEVGLSEHELVVTRRQLDELTDGLALLAGTIDDARRIADDVETLQESAELLQLVIEAAEPVLGALDVRPHA